MSSVSDEIKVVQKSQTLKYAGLLVGLLAFHVLAALLVFLSAGKFSWLTVLLLVILASLLHTAVNFRKLSSRVKISLPFTSLFLVVLGPLCWVVIGYINRLVYAKDSNIIFSEEIHSLREKHKKEITIRKVKFFAYIIFILLILFSPFIILYVNYAS